MDPDALAGFTTTGAGETLYGAGNVAFQGFAGAVEDPLLHALLAELGPDCASVDDAVAAVTAARRRRGATGGISARYRRGRMG